jgi:hypothetical protein
MHSQHSSCSVLGSLSWYDEYKRLCDNVPVVLTEVLTKHTHQVID